MKIVILAVVVAVAVGGLLLISSVPPQDAVAGYNQKIHFVKTLESAPSPGLGHESHQLVFILPMSEGVMYEGIMSYTSNVPVQIAIFHEIDGDGAGQPTWTNGTHTYGWALISPDVKAGTHEFVGSAVAFHTGGDEFVASVALDGWTRAHMIDVMP